MRILGFLYPISMGAEEAYTSSDKLKVNLVVTAARTPLFQSI